MQNGSDFYLIDMALAQNSALVDCVPDSKLKKILLPFENVNGLDFEKNDKKLKTSV